MVSNPTEGDLDALNDMLTDYGQVLEKTVERVRNELGLSPTSRVKNTITILEKLERHGGSWLKSMQDLVGMRIVRPMRRNEQDALTELVVSLFAEADRNPRVIDRRIAPSSGYRAVHVVAFPDEVPVEIQIRTRWQHEWAESFEKLADLVGRDIRYGGPPQIPAEANHRSVAEETVKIAQIVADMVDVVEQAESAVPDEAWLIEARDDVRSALRNLSESVERLRRYT